jgi:hypothetical protein
VASTSSALRSATRHDLAGGRVEDLAAVGVGDRGEQGVVRRCAGPGVDGLAHVGVLMRSS